MEVAPVVRATCKLDATTEAYVYRCESDDGDDDDEDDDEDEAAAELCERSSYSSSASGDCARLDVK